MLPRELTFAEAYERFAAKFAARVNFRDRKMNMRMDIEEHLIERMRIWPSLAYRGLGEELADSSGEALGNGAGA